MRRDRNPVQKAYDRWAATYDSQENPTRDLAGKVLRSFEALFADLRVVVECGCGTGRNTPWLADRAGKVIGLDFSEHMLAIARSAVHSSRVEFFQQDLRDPWPVDGAAADLVFFNLVLEHIEDLAPVFAEARRVLAPGGHVLLTEYHPDRVRRGGTAIIRTEAEEVAIPNFFHSLERFREAAGVEGLSLLESREWPTRKPPMRTPRRCC